MLCLALKHFGNFLFYQSEQGIGSENKPVLNLLKLLNKRFITLGPDMAFIFI